jgi:hypothetical protein
VILEEQNQCAVFAGGMDPCDKVTKLLQCGKDNSPGAVSGLMNNLENAITVKIALISCYDIINIYFQVAPIIKPPKQAVCPTEFKCIVDVHLALA